MSKRRLLICAGLLCLVGRAVAAQLPEKISVLPVPEMAKAKAGVVDTLGTAIEPDARGISYTDLGGESADYVEYARGEYTAFHDTTATSARPVPSGALEDFRSNPNYQYDRVETGGPTLWELFWQWLDDAFLRPLRENTSQQFWTWFWLIAGLIAMAFAISRALRTDSGWFFKKKDEEVEIAGIELLDAEHIETVDLEALLESALHDLRYRDAARYQYLRALQSLADQGLIQWDKHKTNRDYASELRRAGRPALDGPFAEITRLFEWIWYGEFPIDEQRFALVRARFTMFSEVLQGMRV